MNLTAEQLARANDPLAMSKLMWPKMSVFGPQGDMIMSVRDYTETYVVAGNKLGKDYITGRIVIMFFLTPWVFFPIEYFMEIERSTPLDWPRHLRHTRRIVTTSVRDDHLDVLWAEIGTALTTLEYPPSAFCGMDAEITHGNRRMRFRAEVGLDDKSAKNYVKGICSAKEAGFAGHHADYTLGVGDESSGLEDKVHEEYQGWAKRKLYFGNPRPCENFFKTNYHAGDLMADQPIILAA